LPKAGRHKEYQHRYYPYDSRVKTEFPWRHGLADASGERFVFGESGVMAVGFWRFIEVGGFGAFGGGFEVFSLGLSLFLAVEAEHFSAVGFVDVGRAYGLAASAAVDAAHFANLGMAITASLDRPPQIAD
jgi:hypothetical protein